jgi:glutathione S-transferase
VMNKHLSRQDFLADGRYSIADIALYAYTHIAEQCDYDLGPFPAVRDWLDRVVAQQNHVAMDWHPDAAMEAAQ